MIAQIGLEKVKESRISQVDFENLPFGRVFSDHMFVADYENGKWQDPKIQPFKSLSLNPATSALHYGQSFFEGMKAERGPNGDILLFRPELNAIRAAKTARRLAMAEYPVDQFVDAVKELVKLDSNWIPTQEGYSLYIRPFMFASDEYIGVKISDNYQFVVFTCPVGPYYAKPVNVFVEEHYSRAFPGGTGDVKAAGNYAATLYPTIAPRERGFDQILWTDGMEHKYVQEIGTMNVFFIIDNVVITPELNGSILEGVTRSSVIELFRDEGYQVEERAIAVQEVWDAHNAGKLEDCFGTGTAATVIPIASLGRGEGDDVIKLPPVEERTKSQAIKKRMTDIKRGLAEDKFGWIVKA